MLTRSGSSGTPVRRHGRSKARAAYAGFKGLIVAVGILSLCAACGKKGPPRAPELALPERITDLKASTGKMGILLRWTRPTKYVDGKGLTDLAGFVIFRKSVAADCPDCLAPYRERTAIDVEDQDRFFKPSDYEFRDMELEPDTIYRYRVFSRLFDGSLGQPSNEVIVEWNP